MEPYPKLTLTIFLLPHACVDETESHSIYPHPTILLLLLLIYYPTIYSLPKYSFMNCHIIQTLPQIYLCHLAVRKPISIYTSVL